MALMAASCQPLRLSQAAEAVVSLSLWERRTGRHSAASAQPVNYQLAQHPAVSAAKRQELIVSQTPRG
jgi:hypothetical protein